MPYFCPFHAERANQLDDGTLGRAARRLPWDSNQTRLTGDPDDSTPAIAEVNLVYREYFGSRPPNRRARRRRYRSRIRSMSSIILGASMLTGSHVPVASEYEVKNAIAMKIMDLFGAGGSFTEYYAIDFAKDLVLMGHDGPGHVGIAQDKIKVKPLQVYHGKVGRGLSVEMAVKHGPVTLLSVVESPTHGFRLLVAEAQSVPGTILEIGNTNSCYRFAIGARRFVNEWNAEGPAHHCAIGLGHLASKLKKLADLLGLPITQISSVT
jgi:L-arabinose isomerase